METQGYKSYSVCHLTRRQMGHKITADERKFKDING
jgi:hypothetical protein